MEKLRIKPIKVIAKVKDSAWFKKLYQIFSRVRDETKSSSEQEINAAIDQAVKAAHKSYKTHD